ncbi:MAG TPA: zf-HC2 domain-containing protein [Acidimicrobiales bacterium]|nr:zf-HC2 domain-containing protein [Acidimicrobiales bacterium]
MTDRHADFEAISAYVDGEAPEWADHVASCPECRASAAAVRAVAAAVGAPVEGPSAADRDRAIAAALNATAGGHVTVPEHAVPRGREAERARFARRRAAPPWAMPAVAAVVVGLLGLSGLVVSSYRTSDETTTFAGPTAESDATSDTLAQSGGGVGAAAPSVPPGDLGDVADAATLRTRALAAAPPPAAASAGRATSSANSGATGSSASDSGALTPTTTLSQRAAPSVVGTRPCEEQARTREPTLGPVVYFATARQGQVAGFVLGFGAVGSPSTAPLTLLLLAQDGCRELLRAAGP